MLDHTTSQNIFVLSSNPPWLSLWFYSNYSLTYLLLHNTTELPQRCEISDLTIQGLDVEFVKTPERPKYDQVFVFQINLFVVSEYHRKAFMKE